MRDMSGDGDLVSAYAHSLELQIVGRGSSLVCRDEELWSQVEGLMRDRDARETHCLGLDPLTVMEESLAAAAAAAAAAASSARWVKGRGGLQGLERAFEVLEQASLNLHLCPWREEYKVIKMYSGVFTHHIKPMLSMPQIEKLFGLLGYKPGSRPEQLRLQSHRVSPTSLDDLLCLSCAFFLARCECRLLLLALGDYAGEVLWELGVVRERQTGQSLKVALDNTKKMLVVEQQLMAHGDLEVDLYTDLQENGRQARAAVDDESPQSLAWDTHNRASPPAIKTQSNGIASLPSPSTSLSTREPVCVSTLNCQLKTPPESHATRSSSTSARQRRRLAEDRQPHSLQVEVCRSETAAEQMCGCLQNPHVCVKLCRDCNSLHDISCDSLKHCNTERHCVSFPDNPKEEMGKLGAMSRHTGSFRVRASPSLTSSSAAMSSLDLREECKSMTAPISYHDCCDLAQPDPQVLCLSCSVFHTGSCRGIHYCEAEEHDTKSLGVCSCGNKASRDPLVLCRYCGNEYCRDCWYRNPLTCPCGERFDQSSCV